MKFFEKLKDSIIDRTAEGFAASLTVLAAWLAYQIAPAILPAIEKTISTRVLLAILSLSLLLNIAFLLVIWLTSRSENLVLKYGIYWDSQKNPHCPSCKKPLSAYGQYRYSGKGYYCKPCKAVMPLADAQGNRIEPSKAISEL